MKAFGRFQVFKFKPFQTSLNSSFKTKLQAQAKNLTLTEI